MVIMIISLILVAQLIFAYSKANNERAKLQSSPSELLQETHEYSKDI